MTLHLRSQDISRDEFIDIDLDIDPAKIPPRTKAQEKRQRERYEATQADRDWWQAEGHKLWSGETAERNQVAYQRSISIRPDRQYTAHLSCVMDYATIAAKPRIGFAGANLSSAEAAIIAKYQAYQLADRAESGFSDVGCATRVNFEKSRTATRYVFPLDIFPTLCAGKQLRQLLFDELSEPDAQTIFERLDRLKDKFEYIHVDEFDLPDDFPFYPERPS